ncbi:rhomboid family intramembrane serine protease [Mucilaginibacter sp. RS28]|uniref:Rhomboid family intramembrane serine protease n=1 Tax=Mucilaginibacter straminoryzae TaxID=2932774 RepID=A0A9X1X5N6_9SPHI|nr:rhomboid family intramembrane serine protease [Mucilaginibacter straminoryzae]MCJ8211403.1 rhomboid family intramembrane serine protease [Mucilaginibacter straminoryzae]
MSAYRQNPLSNIPPVTKNLLIINIICFIPVLLFSRGGELDPYTRIFGVFYFNSPLFKFWQPITYMFMHGSFMHIFFNMFALYSLGMMLEYVLGSKKFLQFYFICGLGAIALQMIVQAYEVYALTGHFFLRLNGNSIPVTLGDMQSMVGLPLDPKALEKLYAIYFGPMVGASGAIFGIFIAFGMLFPNMELMIMFIPIPIKAKYIMPVYVLIELGLGVGQFSGDSVAHFAHLGGALLGFLLIKIWHVQRPNNFF